MKDGKLSFTEAFWDSETIAFTHSRTVRVPVRTVHSPIYFEIIETEKYCLKLGQYHALIVTFGYSPLLRKLVIYGDSKLYMDQPDGPPVVVHEIRTPR